MHVRQLRNQTVRLKSYRRAGGCVVRISMLLAALHFLSGDGALVEARAGAAPLPVIKEIEWQPFAAQVKRLIEATDYLGLPFSAQEKKSLEAALTESDPAIGIEKLQAILDSHCLFGVQINPDQRVKLAQGPPKAERMAQGWRQCLVKVRNES